MYIAKSKFPHERVFFDLQDYVNGRTTKERKGKEN
jgi:hypothetical protein